MSDRGAARVHDEIEAAWRTYALEHGLQVLACTASPLEMRIEGSMRDVPLRIDGYRASTRGAWPPAHVTVRGRAAVASSGFVRVTPRTALSALAERLGFTRIDTGDGELDRLLYVEGASDASARAILRTPVRGSLLAFAAGGAFEFEVAGADARVTWEVPWPDLARMDAAIALVVATCEGELPRGMYR